MLENSTVCVSVGLKHQELYNAMMSISTLNNQLGNLINDIKGELNKVNEKEQPIKSNPSLVEVLNEGQFVIQEFVNRAHAQIMEIEELLFRR